MADHPLPERWIFGFRRTHRRTLTDEESTVVRRLATRHRTRCTRWGWLAGVCCLAVVVGIAIVATYSAWGWALSAAAAVAFGRVLGYAQKGGNQALLYRRACRKGVVDVYAREERPPSPDGEDFPAQGDWAADERFEEKIAKQAGRTPAGFETPAGDAVLITVEGTVVSEVIDAGKEAPYCEEEA